MSEQTVRDGEWVLSSFGKTGSSVRDIMGALQVRQAVSLDSALALSQELAQAVAMIRELDRVSRYTLKQMQFFTPGGTVVSAQHSTAPTNPATAVGD